jgi:hypothetical protein
MEKLVVYAEGALSIEKVSTIQNPKWYYFFINSGLPRIKAARTSGLLAAIACCVCNEKLCPKVAANFTGSIVTSGAVGVLIAAVVVAAEIGNLPLAKFVAKLSLLVMLSGLNHASWVFL